MMTIDISGKTYGVKATGNDAEPYELTGPRGKRYYVTRNIKSRLLYPLGVGYPAPVSLPTLADFGGNLRVWEPYR